MKLISLAIRCLCASFSLCSVAEGALTYIESTNGDLSGLGAAPTILDLGIGENTIFGTMGRTTAVDADIFSFSIVGGQSLTSISLLDFAPANSAFTGSFFAIAFGSTINTSDGNSHAANSLVDGSPSELLSPDVLLGEKFSGGDSTLTNPLGPGNYTIWFQETSTSVQYTLRFTVVPEPSTLALASFAFALAARRRRSYAG